MTKPSIARVYDAMLGGKDNFEVDRQMMAQLTETWPAMPLLARENRAFLRRAVSWLAGEAGVDQFLDLGAGLPTMDNTHEVAQRYNPDAVVVYVDNDPAVAAFGRALLEDTPNSHFCVGDYTKPAEVLADPIIAEHLDPTRPIAVLHLFTLHFVAGQAEASACVSGYLDGFVAGSYVVISHGAVVPEGDGRNEKMGEVVRRVQAYAPNTTSRTPRELVALTEGLELMEPGVVPITEWWSDGPHTELDDADTVVGLVARKP